MTYNFSAPTSDSYAYCRLENIQDTTGNQLTCDYDGAVGVGKLTKVTAPSGDSRYLQLSYSGNLITKAALWKSGAASALESYSYAYDSSGPLTSETNPLTDNAPWPSIGGAGRPR